MIRLLLLSFLFSIGLVPSLSALGQETLRQPIIVVIAPKPLIFLDVQAHTWRPHGRISFGIIPSLKIKLASAGFAVTEAPDDPHDLTLRVEYREERGAPISHNLFGTELTCILLLDHPQQGRLLSTTIHESPAYAGLVTAPYVEVVEKFQTNPYFYFLGDLIRGRIDAGLDTTGGLIQALDRQIDRQRHTRPGTPLDTLESPSETFSDLDLHYAALALENAVEELGRLKDGRALDLLKELMFHPDSRTRLRAVLALGEFDAPSLVPAMARVVLGDSDVGVRNAAKAVLAKLSTQ